MTDARRACEPILTELLTLYPALLATGSLPPTKSLYRKNYNGIFAGHYVNDWYVTTGSKAQWSPYFAHC